MCDFHSDGSEAKQHCGTVKSGIEVDLSAYSTCNHVWPLAVLRRGGYLPVTTCGH